MEKMSMGASSIILGMSKVFTRTLRLLCWILVGVVILTGCKTQEQSPQILSTSTLTEIPIPTQTTTPSPIRVYIDPKLPSGFRNQFSSLPDAQIVETVDASQVQLTFSVTPSDMFWVYALVAPFPTVTDGVDLTDLKRAWAGDFSTNVIKQPILLSEETKDVFSSLWGEPSKDSVQILASDLLQKQAWKDVSSWAIVPFEELNPQWKVLEIEGKSPLSKDFSYQDYSLSINMNFKGDQDSVQRLEDLLHSDQHLVNLTNRDPSLLSVVMVTGTTALTRDIGKQMDAKGIMYPASDIMNWFKQANIIHISNEVSFMDGCDLRDRGKLCAKPAYLELLIGIGTQVVELTGNHLLDFGPEPFLATLELYRQAGLKTYGGGMDLTDAQKPLLIEDHGNKIAFLGCNYGQPQSDLATTNSPGANPCNNGWMKSTIQDLKKQGYLVIFTFQDMESCTIEPLTSQRGDFFRAAEDGADIVSGSQSHCPQTMTFHQGAFIHYGLGNFFFDQMDPLQQREMVDLHYFYNGRYISTQFLTGILEDSAKPRPMNPTERMNLLTQVFENSVWEK